MLHRVHDVEAVLAESFSGQQPEWMVPFLKATEVLRPLEKKERERKGMDDAEQASVGLLSESDQATLRKAEAYLLNAAAMNNQEPLLYTWLSNVYEKLQDFPRARDAALRIVLLKPLDPFARVHLSRCYESERDYIKAYAAMKKAIASMPSLGRSPYDEKLEQLAEQAAKQKSDGLPRDPLSILPFELVINIMNLGLAQDRNFALKQSWVCRSWRAVLNSCQELYDTYHINGNVLPLTEKRQAWLERSGGKFHSVDINGISLSGITKLSKLYDPPFRSCKTLRIRVKDNHILRRLMQKIQGRFHNLTHVDIRTDETTPVEPALLDSVPLSIHCDFAATSSYPLLQSIKVRNVDFRDVIIPAGTVARGRMQYAKDRQLTAYPSLRRLVVEGCHFDSDAKGKRQSRDDQHSAPARSKDLCPLHLALNGSPGLSYLRVLCRNPPNPQEPNMTGDRIVLDNLTTAILPPPAFLPLELRARNLSSLTYTFFDQTALGRYESGYHYRPPTLLPAIEDSPLELDGVSRLKRFEFVGGSTDKFNRAEDWLSQLSSVETLVITFISDRPNEPFEELARSRLLDDLIANPAWCPRLRFLSPRGTGSGPKFVKLVESRELAGTPLTALKLYSPTMSAADCGWLQKHVHLQHTRNHRIQYYSGSPCTCPCHCLPGRCCGGR